MSGVWVHSIDSERKALETQRPSSIGLFCTLIFFRMRQNSYKIILNFWFLREDLDVNEKRRDFYFRALRSLVVLSFSQLLSFFQALV
jgi:hypothetical protein